MIHTIQADFYRLFRSKGFWITEFILFSLMLMGASIGATGHLMAIQTEEPEIPTHGWDGVQALINASSQGSNLVFLCIILTCLVLGVDLIGKLYKNSLTVGISRTEFFLAKAFVLACIALLQVVISLVIAFIPATILNGLGTMPDGFIGNLLITIFLQFLASLLGFPLFPLFSMLVILILQYLLAIWSALSYFLCQCSFFQISKFCHIYRCSFFYAMTANSESVFYTIIVTLAVILIFNLSGLAVFKKKSL